MRTIYAEYNINHDSIDVYTSAGYMLRIDWLGWVCYKLHSLWINRTPKNNPCTYEVTNQ